MSSVAQILLAALAVTAVQAAPQMRPASNSSVASYMPMAKSDPAPADAAKNKALLEELAVIPTAVGRFQKLLVGDNGELLKGQDLVDRTVFDFKKNAKRNKDAKGNEAKGGALSGADVASFPILKDLELSTTVGFLDACGMNTAHVHPRATEFLTVIEGEVETGMILENKILEPGKGTGEIRTHLGHLQGTVFPQGSIHYQFNPSCKPAVFVANLNSEDPGANQIAQGFFNLDGDVVDATLGFPKQSIAGKDIEQFRKNIPLNVALGVEQCLKKCHIPKTGEPNGPKGY